MRSGSVGKSKRSGARHNFENELFSDGFSARTGSPNKHKKQNDPKTRPRKECQIGVRSGTAQMPDRIFRSGSIWRSGSRTSRSGQMTYRNAYRCSANLAAQPIWQSGSLANLAIWRLSQSGKSIRSPEWAIWRLSQSGNLVLHPIWCNLAMSPIWPTWYESQSGNLADGPIWHEHTKLIIMMRFLRKIPAKKA